MEDIHFVGLVAEELEKEWNNNQTDHCQHVDDTHFLCLNGSVVNDLPNWFELLDFTAVIL